ncbi:hypothetical protein KDW_06780 [Dictyobacter vulcani]|uniref:Uncharacterized protein n=1 Tax=Dictyobacter vulcani TaxID=2607529 RepID=A0A5J4KMV9_9CHLR|nr:hypothetical protein [Dictyobacter vulcani]GER86516.1 hypothetical protein KDW_06780 [Dictyobacter vulcani]
MHPIKKINNEDIPDIDILMRACSEYLPQRLTFLRTLKCSQSKCDPLAKFSERLVAKLCDGDIVDKEDNADYDVIVNDKNENIKIQVKYIYNDGNTHSIRTKTEKDKERNWDRYAVVFFDSKNMDAPFIPKAVVVLPKNGLAAIYNTFTHKRGSRKLHPALGFDLTSDRFKQFLIRKEEFKNLDLNGLQIWSREDIFE